MDTNQHESGFVDPQIVYPELRLGEHQTELLKRLGVPAGHMPYLMQPLNPAWRIVFMWNIWNPFQPPAQWRPVAATEVESRKSKVESQVGPSTFDLRPSSPRPYWGSGSLPAQMDSCVGDPKWRVLVKMFGWIERIGQLALGNFNPETHVVRGEVRAALDLMVKQGKSTVYYGADPETQRSHAGLWLAVFPPSGTYPKGLKYLFDETPRMREGEWVNANGERGEGQFIYRATGANWYKRYLREREREWNICDLLAAEYGVEGRRSKVEGQEAALHPCVVQRRGDPRGFATEESTATGVRSLFDLYLEEHQAEHPDCYPMVFQPAKIRRASTLDIDIIIALLKYDEDKAVIDGGLTAENTPELLVSDRCENFIRCALNYTLTELGKADEDNPYRDFIDALRYTVSGDLSYVDTRPEAMQANTGGAWT